MKNDANKVTLTFTGDVMCLREQIHSVDCSHGTRSYSDIFAHASRLWKDSDYVVGNLETPVAGACLGYASRAMSFNAPDEFLDAVRKSGIDFVSLANNHCMDRGIRGLETTVRKVRAAGIDMTGAYLSQDESHDVFVKEIKGIRFAIIGCTYAFNRGPEDVERLRDEDWRVDVLTALSFDGAPLPSAWRRLVSGLEPHVLKTIRRAVHEEYSGRRPTYLSDAIYPKRIGKAVDEKYERRILDKIARARQLADFVICLPHIGGQYNPAPGEYQKRTMKLFADCGVDLIVANHAHTPLRCEVFPCGRLGAYALGNFCFTPGVGYYESETLADYSVLLNVTVEKCVKGAAIVGADFSVLKSLPDGNGGALVMPVSELHARERNLFARERLAIENEVAVNRFRGGAETVGVQEKYEYRIKGMNVLEGT